MRTHYRSLVAAWAAGALAVAGCTGEAQAPARAPVPIATPRPSSTAPPSSEQARADFARVRQVIDGDTITVSGVGTVRLIGVDAPEKTGGYRASEPFGDRAAAYMRELVGGKLVRLEYDGDRLDQYKRTLAYVFLEDGTCANEAIIRAGWAEVYRRFQYVRKPQFQAAEADARRARRGMWAF
ncbi:MAG: thermonuclease family protein [Vicinamibacterales bacterium]